MNFQIEEALAVWFYIDCPARAARSGWWFVTPATSTDLTMGTHRRVAFGGHSFPGHFCRGAECPGGCPPGRSYKRFL